MTLLWLLKYILLLKTGAGNYYFYILIHFYLDFSLIQLSFSFQVMSAGLVSFFICGKGVKYFILFQFELLHLTME